MKKLERKKTLIIALFGIGIISFGCNPEEEKAEVKKQVILEAEEADGSYPYKRLSTYGFFEGEITDLNATENVVLYEPASSLFTDYAWKSRFVYFPEGEVAQINEEEEIDFPEGTIIIKNFYYPEDFRNPKKGKRIIETRLMINGTKGWEAWPYIWNDEQTDAILKVVGGSTQVAFTNSDGQEQLIDYIIPNKNQCKSCHNKSEVMTPIGVKVKHLNNELNYGFETKNQLAFWSEQGYLNGFKGLEAHPAMINYETESLPLDQRAMAYLDINCSHCHSAEGPASTSGLFLTYDQKDPMKLGINKTPVAAGNGAGSYIFDIYPGKGDESIMTHRMNSTEVGVAMPEIGRTTIHTEGVQLIRDWINSLESE
ncbi:SO2930 family diheme c-type cytochrome [Algoriphagus sediminis]|uniref:SO2930 family diheme c-type cytochrome n=1 Tax=Algoriphagus sediminis TaxID=3057113 RepID=A0ABT7Y949_9BACT|nr:SO2930 family diheme c-type cytochrome [Algoriphagus sediminis]MDN3203045.1 SO2930 family diheme c-type cytochrome [Algoriphagus sediminis]